MSHFGDYLPSHPLGLALKELPADLRVERCV